MQQCAHDFYFERECASGISMHAPVEAVRPSSARAEIHALLLASYASIPICAACDNLNAVKGFGVVAREGYKRPWGL
eukprot:9326064-Alexandrium_andersonii.AAC.1